MVSEERSLPEASESTGPKPAQVELGTPLTANATTVMLLGSGELSRELAIAFHRFGVEVHAVDRTSHAPAQQVAHYAHVVDVSDPVAVTQLIRRVRPDFIIPEIETIAADVLEAVEERGHATVVPSAKAAALSTNRERMRRLAAEELGLPTPSYMFVSTHTEFEVAIGSLGYPVVAKAAEQSTRPNCVIESEEDVERAWEVLCDGQPETRLVVEKLVDFDYELAMLAVRSTDPATGQLATWFCEPIGYKYDAGQYVESWQPMRISEEALGNARSVAARVSNALGGRGVFSVKMFVAGDDVYFSEVHARPHETGLVTIASQRLPQFELHSRAILNMPIDVTLTSPGAACSLFSTVDAHSVRITGLGEALAVPESRVELFGKQDATIGRGMGVALATAETIGEAAQRARAVADAISVENTVG
ncbi:phosphoribosylglycinamide formyltransferase 2 [Corynebacterium renale]|uniref:formate-dependent phosphoribosylglycinamide formyltransferase n=2 Tax=Corynebacterium renale TaxID=1724 RepID=UPI000DA2E1A4|nr:formate-dependent phosphoribosylglycinamide formyltransferase [Corynebacterium renale]SQG63328.1 phosphoribosylglycinamide formyltransferase 2 [Corynebacterium renale]STC99560.1 phosphoribosylglycinamide formyltransferase 2 [Corynebacterium renale]